MDTWDRTDLTWFDSTKYLEYNPDIRAAGVDAEAHWLEYGREEERQGRRRPWFAPRFASKIYATAYPDVVPLIDSGAFASFAEHWAASGREELRNGLRALPANFDEEAYLSRRPDVARAVADGLYLNGFDHWLQWGASEEGLAIHPPGDTLPNELTFDSTGFEAAFCETKAAFWAHHGYLILEGVISPELCDRLNDRIDRLWAERETSALGVSIDIYLERPDSVRIPMGLAPADARALPYKINDLFLVEDDARALALHDDVVAALRWILRSDPSVIGSLNFERGSTQKFHTDTLYMPGRTSGGMTAAWFALEDISADAGPLKYYPGSHEIPLFRFSSGGPWQINEEVPHYDAYMTKQVEERGLTYQHFLPKKGDVLIWHEKLYHGGAQIEDLNKTRKSMVVHYWRSAEMDQDEIVAWGPGYYWNRAPMA